MTFDFGVAVASDNLGRNGAAAALRHGPHGRHC